MRQLLSASSLLAFVAACSDTDSTVMLSDDSAPEEPIAVAHFALKSSLPSCGKSTAGAVYYIIQDEQLVYCDGKKYQDVEFPCDPSWLVAAGAATSCTYGGTTLSAGPDHNGNGKLDKKEVVSSAAACNGAPGATGPTGPQGPAGANGTNGATGAPGPQGPNGATGATGATGAIGVTGATGANGTNGTDGSSCSVHDNGDGTYLLTCTDGTSVTLHDGGDGAPGVTGPQGPQGPAGSSCSVHDNGNHTYDVTCQDGSHVTISDGQDGEDATLGPVLINTMVEPKGAHCHNGGNLVQVGVDSDLSGVLEPDEVTSSDYACAPLAEIHGDVFLFNDSDVQKLRGVRAVFGRLFLDGSSSVTALHDAATDLARIDSLHVGGSGIVTFDAGAIFEGLPTIGSVSIQNAQLLTSVNFDWLNDTNTVEVISNPVLATVSFNQLSTAALVHVDNNAALTSISLPQLSSVHILDVRTDAALTNFGFPQLTTVDEFLGIRGNAALASISFPQLTIGGVNLDFRVTSNPLLPNCRALDLKNQLTPAPAFVTISGNSASCPP
jgi:hypothetical protein